MYVYIMASCNRNLLYIGVTNNLARRVYEHKNELYWGYTAKYHIHDLVYFEVFTDAKQAIMREKQLKKWRRKKKTDLVESMNPEWADLSFMLYE